MLIIGLDDTDVLESPGTGRLARRIAAALAPRHAVLGVTRHQLLRDPRVPYTKNNSAAAVLVAGDGDLDPLIALDFVRDLMLQSFQAGSDPGLCVARVVPRAIAEFGRLTQTEVVTQAQARALAAAHNIPLVGLGGSEDGVIGALAAVGLAATGEDGRYVQVGRTRELAGRVPVEVLLAAGVAAVQDPEGRDVTEGMVQADRLRPVRRSGRAVVVVEWAGDHWQPLKLD